MKRIIRRSTLFILSWAILNAGAFGWIKVCCSSGQRAGNGSSIMAEIEISPEHCLTLRILGHDLSIDTSSINTEQTRFLLAAAEPLLAAADVFWNK